ncbi:MBL fold metallo-hydrolase [Actinoplanes sp. LDG1-06]|uniref:MBL fold metallo-hydrolase n=1 Tax=Paractinoplanes ovalisporus TaxID=2810368 RepID=A0ABS2A6F4_9ACTN|nr:MBL fold metallo-hydrolase [Actinoplanes ovalisporus]MBM2615406.1 MBL fold metallo-hydrolase [Actinoplanes ovalisporus]
MTLDFRSFGGPTVTFTLGGLRFVTDPTFDEPGRYPIGDRALTKTKAASGTAEDAAPVDVVLLSHDEHPDNLDRSGRAFALAAPLVLTTVDGAARLGAPARGLKPWESVTLPGGAVVVTAVPAQHGPPEVEHLTGPVIGFVLQGQSLPTVYVSGDNASLDVVREIAARFPSVDVAVLFGGAARTPLVGDVNLTLSAAEMAEAAQILDASVVVPAHVDSWEHFTEGIDDVQAAFTEAGLADRLA